MQYREAGIYALNHGETDVAVACFEAALRIGPKSAAIYNNLGVARTERGDLEQARTAFREALHREPSQAWVWANYGRLLIRTKEWRSAASAFSKAQGLDMENLNYAMSEAWCWLQEGKAEAAMEILLGYTIHGENDPEFLILFVEAGIKAGYEEMLFRWLERANWSLIPEKLRLFFAGLSLQQGQPEEALLLLEDLEPGEQQAYLLLLATLRSADREEFVKALEERKELLLPAQRYELEALFALSEERKEDALTAWEKVITLRPSVRVELGMIRILRDLDQNKEADQRLDQLMELHPDHPEVLWEQARDMSSEEPGKLRLLDSLLLRRPWHLPARMERGYLHLNGGRTLLAIGDFEFLANKQPGSYDALLGMALSHDQAGHDKKSLEAFHRMAELFPDRPQVWWNLATATATAATNNWKQTLEAVTNFLSFDPEDVRAISLKGRALFKLGRTKEAGEVWRGES